MLHFPFPSCIGRDWLVRCPGRIRWPRIRILECRDLQAHIRNSNFSNIRWTLYSPEPDFVVTSLLKSRSGLVRVSKGAEKCVSRATQETQRTFKILNRREVSSLGGRRTQQWFFGGVILYSGGNVNNLTWMHPIRKNTTVYKLTIPCNVI